MKRTKSMIYKETSKSIDLFLYATSDDDLYRRMITPIIENLRKKAIKGAYDKEKAVDAYYYIATEASKNYKPSLIKPLSLRVTLIKFSFSSSYPPIRMIPTFYHKKA